MALGVEMRGLESTLAREAASTRPGFWALGWCHMTKDVPELPGCRLRKLCLEKERFQKGLGRDKPHDAQ